MASIDRIERQLADDFGTTETAPLINEHETLCQERDRLLARLAQRR